MLDKARGKDRWSLTSWMIKDADGSDDKDKDDQTEDNREMSDKLPDCSYDQ